MFTFNSQPRTATEFVCPLGIFILVLCLSILTRAHCYPIHRIYYFSLVWTLRFTEEIEVLAWNGSIQSFIRSAERNGMDKRFRFNDRCVLHFHGRVFSQSTTRISNSLCILFFKRGKITRSTFSSINTNTRNLCSSDNLVNIRRTMNKTATRASK